MITQRESSCADQGVPFSDITVIVHGPVLKDVSPAAPAGTTLAAVQSVRKALPGARVVISTWTGSEAEGMGADLVVYSADPGALPCWPNARLNNVNRQIVAMRAGLEAVGTKWVLKLRSDTLLTSAAMVKCWGRYQERNPCYRVFQERIITSALLTWHPRECFQEKRFTPFLFHVNDMIQFGLSCDMHKLWCIPLMPTSDFTYFKCPELVGRIDRITNRRVPEDYIWTTALSAAGFPTNDSWLDFNPSMIPVSELSIVNNFQLLDHDDMGFSCLKYPNFGDTHHPIGAPFFTHHKWLVFYGLYCDPDVRIPRFSRPSVSSCMRALRVGLSLSRTAEFIKYATRPLRYRVKAVLKAFKLWK